MLCESADEEGDGHAAGKATASKAKSGGKGASKATSAGTDDADADGEDDESSAFNAPTSVFESKTHLLHGVLHANGRGHLLRHAPGGLQRRVLAPLAQQR